MVTETPEIERSKSNSPGSIQPLTMFQPTKKLPRRAVNVHVPQARAVGFHWGSLLVERIGNYNNVANRLHIEGHEVVRQALIDERSVYWQAWATIEAVVGGVLFVQADAVKCVVPNIDAAFRKIGGVKIPFPVHQSAGQACVGRSIACSDHRRRMS